MAEPLICQTLTAVVADFCFARSGVNVLLFPKAQNLLVAPLFTQRVQCNMAVRKDIPVARLGSLFSARL